MNWTDNINQAIDLIEKSLSEGLNIKQIENIMACPFTTFQKTFSQISGVSVAEYIRRRKLTLAAYDLQNTNMKVLDTAVKYGYESADSFRIAFKNLHGVNPSEAKKTDVMLKFYSRLQFEIKIKGVSEMDYKLVGKQSFKVVGMRKTTPYGGGTWAIVKNDGSFNKLMEQSGVSESLGLCFGFDEDGNNDYMCGVEWDNPDNLDYDEYTYPDLKWLIFLAEGKLSDDTLSTIWDRVNNEFLPNSKYQKNGMPTIERYIVWDEKNDYCKVEIRIPT
jgi:AraC family transcriptional regulator